MEVITAVRLNIIEKKDTSFEIRLTERMKSCSKLIVNLRELVSTLFYDLQSV